MTKPHGHDRLIAYEKAVDLAAALEDVADGIATRRPDLRDQLLRASASMPLNIAEGAGEFSPADKARFYRIARRSASECTAILDVLERRTPGIGGEKTRRKLGELSAILTAMVKTMEDRKR
ncbi:MAG: four helix bundle protein [Methanobacteriota archaeon]